MMLANFFGKSKPVNFILIIALYAIYVILFINAYSFDHVFSDFWLIELGSFLVIFAFFFIYNFIVSKNKLTQDNSYAFLFFVMSLGFLPTVISDFKSIFINFVLLLFLRKIYSLRSQKSIFSKLFDSGLWLGVAFVLEPFVLVYGLLIFAAIFLFLKKSIRVIIIPFLGFGVPMFLYFTYCFYTNQMLLFNKLFDFSISYDFRSYQTVFYQVTFGLFGIFVLLSVFVRSSTIFSVNDRFKRSWILVIFHLFLAIVFVGILKTRNGAELIAVSFPASIIIANWVQSIEKKGVIDILILFFLGISFGIHFIA